LSRLLDTNICIYFLNEKSDKLIRRFQEVTPADIKLPAVTVAELFYGAEKSKARKKNRQKVDAFIQPFEIIPFDEQACRVYGKIRSKVESLGTPIGPMDLLIASIGLAHDYVLITNNTKEFKRIKGLKIDNWL